MNIFLIILLCHIFPLSIATFYQPSYSLATWNTVKWDDECKKTVVPLSSKSSHEDPRGGTDHIKSVSKQAVDPWEGELKSQSANLFKNKSVR